MPKPMNKEMGGKPKMSGDQMKVLGRVMKYMLKNYKFSFIIVVACILIQAVTTLAGMMFMQSLVDDYITPMLKTSSHDFSPLAKALGGLRCGHCGFIRIQQDNGKHRSGYAEKHKR